MAGQKGNRKGVAARTLGGALAQAPEASGQATGAAAMRGVLCQAAGAVSGGPGQGAEALGQESHQAMIIAEAERVQRFLRSKLANPADAQDLAQEAYLRLLRAKEPQLIQDPVAYLFRIARNLVGEFYTKLPPAADSVEDIELTDDGTTVEGLAESDQQVERLSEVLAHLSPKCQAALVLHRRDGMTVNEIAEELGVSAGSVKKYLAQGLARCRARLRRFHE